MSADRTARDRGASDGPIVVDEGIVGGTPVIRGTRMTVYSVLGRVAHGDTIDDILAENPDLSRKALEAAVTYARAHPLIERPGGRPWEPVAPLVPCGRLTGNYHRHRTSLGHSRSAGTPACADRRPPEEIDAAIQAERDFLGLIYLDACPPISLLEQHRRWGDPLAAVMGRSSSPVRARIHRSRA